MDLFKTRDHVSNFDEYVSDYTTMSRKTRGNLECDLNIKYGSSPRSVLDVFYPARRERGKAVHLFIHGGYWRMFSKDDFSFIADTVTACGAIAVIMDYDLMPTVRMADVVRQTRSAWRWICHNAEELGGASDRLSISGHSAGAHLATFTFCSSQECQTPKSALLMSGIYDLAPLQNSFLKPLIGITDDEVETFSPVKIAHSPQTRVFISFGDRETEPFSAQANSFRKALIDDGMKCSVTTLLSSNHMSVVKDMGVHHSGAAQLLQLAIHST